MLAGQDLTVHLVHDERFRVKDGIARQRGRELVGGKKRDINDVRLQPTRQVEDVNQSRTPPGRRRDQIAPEARQIAAGRQIRDALEGFGDLHNGQGT